LGVFVNTFGYSEGLDEKREILRGGLNNYGILRAWGGGVTHFGISEGKGV